IYSTGMSNGGMFTHPLAGELSDRIASFASVSGPLGLTTCNPPRAISLLHFPGTSDPIVGYNGNAGLSFPPIPHPIAGWATRDQCGTPPTQTFHNGDTTCVSYPNCMGGAELIFCTIDGGGHTWPGGYPVPSLGKTSTDINATSVMWDFFSRHPLP